MDFFKRNLPWVVSFALAVLFVGGYRLLLSPPSNFPSGSIVIIPDGSSAPLVAKELSDAHVVAQPMLLQLILRISGKSDGIQAGAYRFQTPQNLFIIAYRITTGEYGIPFPRVTFPEGMTLSEMASQAAGIFPEISAAEFLRVGEPYEGYLFPDTYFFQQTADAETIVKAMRANFNTKITQLSKDVAASGHSLSDTVKMASLIEKEARTGTDKHIVAGILWHRIALGMPLQVDASRDTYAHTGFPPAPICNPGLDSFIAALHPTETKYLYYLTGNDGLMHYATTFAEHQSNLRKYLK